MKALNLVVAIFLITISLNLSNCFAGSKNSAKLFDREAWIPADFNPENTVLLIEKRTYINKKGKDEFAKENEVLDEIMKKNYPYPYEFVLNANGEKYSDKNKYPYMISWGSHYHEYMNQSDHIVSGSSGVKTSLINLKTGVESRTNEWFYSYRKGILEATIKQLVKVYKERKKQQK